MAIVTLMKITPLLDKLHFSISIGRGYYRRECTMHQLYQEEYRKKFPDLAGWYAEYIKQVNTIIERPEQMIGKPVHVRL